MRRETPKTVREIKKEVIFILSLLVFLILILAIANKLNSKNSNNQNSTKIEEEEPKETISDSDSSTNTKNYFDKLEKEKSKEKKSNEYEEKNQDNNSINDNYNQDYVQNETNELMKAYFSKLIQEEEQARTSGIGFSTNNSNNNQNQQQNQQNSNNNYQQNGNNLNLDKYSEQNQQNQKKEFLNTNKNKFYNSQYEEMPISSYEVMAGTFIPATLITGINSDLPSDSVALVREDVYDSLTGNYLLIPKGTKLIGKYDSGVSFGQTRLLIVWQRLIFPNGKYIGLDNMGGIDLSGYAGLTGKVNNHFLKLLQAVVLSSAMGAGSAVVTNKNGDDDDWRGEAGKGAGQVILDFGNKMGEKIINQQPTIEIKQGYRFNIMVQSDLILTPYGRK